jgi:hypothetical protein
MQSSYNEKINVYGEIINYSMKEKNLPGTENQYRV